MIMSELNIEILKQIVEKIPNDFIVEFEDINGSTCIVSDNINIKVSEKKLTLKKYWNKYKKEIELTLTLTTKQICEYPGRIICY